MENRGQPKDNVIQRCYDSLIFNPEGVNAGNSDAAEAIRDLVETVTVFRNPSHPGGVTVEIVGRLNALLGEQAYPHNVQGVGGKMVAREGLEPPTPGL